MRTSIFRYFSNRDWAENFVLGNIRFGSLSYYQQVEDGSRRDGGEGVLRHNHGGKLTISNITQGNEMNLVGFSFVSQVRSDDIFISSFSRSLNSHLWCKFSAVCCVEILRLRPFIAQVRESISNDFELHFERVNYADEQTSPQHTWALPEKVASRKSPSFASEMESRLILGRKEVFAVENVSLNLVQGDSETIKAAREPSFMEINVGDLSAQTKVHYQLP